MPMEVIIFFFFCKFLGFVEWCKAEHDAHDFGMYGAYYIDDLTDEAREQML